MYVRGCVRSRGRFSRPTLTRNQELVSEEGSSIITGETSPTPSIISSLTTQLDSLSTATDDSDNRPTVSKFPTTRPIELISKQGQNGQHIDLVANYVQILATPKWDLYQYHCSFEPQEKLLSGKHPITNELITIQIKRTSISSPQSPEFFHLANLIVRKLLEITGLKLLGRNYYSFENKIELDRYKLTLFPGFMTSVNVYEGQLMINVDLSTKVMNKQTVYSILMEQFKSINNMKQAQDASLKELVGQIVLTPYNYETYKILDIAWDKDPHFLFTKQDGTEQTLIEFDFLLIKKENDCFLASYRCLFV